MTVAGLAFSITIVTLQLVSGQYSPRSARTLLDDRVNQAAAGVFVGIVLYCLVVLRSVRDEGAGDFVPRLAVSGAIVLAVVGLAMLLVFVNHMAQSIKLPRIAARIGRRTLEAIDRLYPEPYGAPGGEEAVDAAVRWLEQRGRPLVVFPSRPGYVQQARLDELVDDLGGRETRIFVEVAPGDFVTERQPLASVWPSPDAAGQERVERAVRGAILVDDERDLTDDVGFGLQQLSDIVLRALSPGVNDPSTAVTCIAYLGACLERIAARSFPAELRRFADGTETAARRPSFRGHLETGFAGVARAAAQDPRVVKAAFERLDSVARVAEESGSSDRAEAVRELVDGLLVTVGSRRGRVRAGAA
jgi:uncharacterized membrane protein